MDQNLDRLLTALDVAPHAFSVCRVQSGWRMTFPAFKVLTVHIVLQGEGYLGVGQSEPIPFAPSSVLVVPALQSDWVGDAASSALVGPDSLASLAGMSRASYCDYFSRTFGQGLIEFVQRTRLRVAARLLDVTDLPVLAIAQSIGYAGSR